MIMIPRERSPLPPSAQITLLLTKDFSRTRHQPTIAYETRLDIVMRLERRYCGQRTDVPDGSSAGGSAGAGARAHRSAIHSVSQKDIALLCHQRRGSARAANRLRGQGSHI